MKRFITNSLLAIAFILGMSAMGVNVWENVWNDDVIIQDYQAINNDKASSPLDNNYFFDIDEPFISAGLDRTANSRIPTTKVVDTQGSNHLLRAMSHSKLAFQQLYTTKSIYDSFYAEKRMSGYYLYTLRQLLI